MIEGSKGEPLLSPLEIGRSDDSDEQPATTKDLEEGDTWLGRLETQNSGSSGSGAATEHNQRNVAPEYEPPSEEGGKKSVDISTQTDSRKKKKRPKAEEDHRKRGHRFLCCCDSKRAVIYLNLIILLLNLFTFIVTVIKADPAMEGYLRVMIIRGSGLVVTLCTILGAYWYSQGIVAVGLAFTCYLLAMSTLEVVRYDWTPGAYNEDPLIQIIFPLVWNCLIFYADAVFIVEVSDGTITPENYKRRERWSCCCFLWDSIV
mmetsp:Transcript_34801/g.83221  ORF Transcript_34801/g.83221 Transcript_34801/m.83221 type:complete len:260 (-) Transcript_34801:251-1030(-)